MGKSNSWFDLNHDWITGDDLIWVQKIWFGNVIWFGFDFILCDLIWWFEQIATFSNLDQWIMITLLAFFTCSLVEPLISVIVPSLIFAETLTVRPDIHWWHFAHRLLSRELLSFGWHRDLVWFVICVQVIWIRFHFMWFDLWFGIMI